MTRESKLAVIVGFALVLVVGVLISDHLSRARQVEVADGVTGTDEAALVFAPLSELPSETAEAPFMEMALASNETPAQRESVRTAPSEPIVPPIEIKIGEAYADESLSLPAGGGLLENATRIEPDPEALRRVAEAEGLRLNPVAAAGVDDDPAPAPPGLTDPLPSGRIVPVAMAKPAPSRVEVPAAAEYHIVQPGDTLYAIAAEHLGAGSRWRELVGLNPDLNPDVISVGTRLRVRSSGRTPAVRDPLLIASNDAPASAARSNSVPGTPREYVVKKGDVLGVIAMEQLGTMKRKQEIMELNDIEDENFIRVGMTLRLPKG